mgnify:CR=1 FL=1
MRCLSAAVRGSLFRAASGGLSGHWRNLCDDTGPERSFGSLFPKGKKGWTGSHVCQRNRKRSTGSQSSAGSLASGGNCVCISGIRYRHGSDPDSGSSGSGKSTITKLLLKYYEPESGTISVGGVDLDEYSNASVRRAIAYVPQNVELFSKTIYDNIRISRPEASLDEVKAAAKKADAHEFIRKLPLQYNTYLEEAGNGLSGGEKQRLALARAFLKDANLYILDESTSSLDFGTENTIFDMIYNQLADRSMLIVAHRLSTIRDCDLILVMDHGEIVERGTHEELLEKQGKYYELWSLQQGIFRDKKRGEKPAAPVSAAKVVEDEDDGESITY